MKNFVIQQFDLNDVKSILEEHKKDMLGEIESLISERSPNPQIVSLEKLIEILECSSSWLSKVTTSGEIPSFTIGRRVYYDLNEISKLQETNKLPSFKKRRN